ncbi:MAG: DUF302 domain-containing protein [Chthonomonadales bacterium]
MAQSIPAGDELSACINAPFEEVKARVKEAFQAEGFGTLTEIDVCKTLKDKIGFDLENYCILGVCNPRLASRAITVEHEIGMYLPCSVVVHECGGAVNVRVQDPKLMMEMLGNPDLAPIADEARSGVVRAMARLRS